MEKEPTDTMEAYVEHGIAQMAQHPEGQRDKLGPFPAGPYREEIKRNPQGGGGGGGGAARL